MLAVADIDLLERATQAAVAQLQAEAEARRANASNARAERAQIDRAVASSESRPRITRRVNFLMSTSGR